jgi:two-component system, NarL family, invasion response regulator UvrY
MRDIIKLALVDDHKLFRDGLAELINSFENWSVAIEADNGRDFMDKIAQGGAPDVVLLDINMKDMDGYETAKWLRDNYPDTLVLALSMYDDETAIIRMLRLGARGYLLKDIRKKELQTALQSLIEKGYYYTDHITGRLIHTIRRPDDQLNKTHEAYRLTDKEIEFLKLVCTELTYKEVAEKMCLSVHTIDGYREALFQKLNLKSRTGLVLYAIKNRIVSVS